MESPIATSSSRASGLALTGLAAGDVEPLIDGAADARSEPDGAEVAAPEHPPRRTTRTAAPSVRERIAPHPSAINTARAEGPAALQRGLPPRRVPRSVWGAPRRAA